MHILEMAIQHFRLAADAEGPEETAAQIAVGLQQFCVGVQSYHTPDILFQVAISNFYKAQNVDGMSETLALIAVGLQQFCAAYNRA